MAAGLAAACLMAGCYRPGRGAGATGAGTAAADTRRAEGGVLADPVRVYQRMGLLAEGGAMPFVGSVGYFAAARPDSTLMVITVSLAANALTFQREGDRYRASYTVRTELRRNDSTFLAGEAEEVVRVAGFKETTREDESVLAQRIAAVAPGAYTLSVTLRDAGSARSATAELPLVVPRVSAPGVSTPLVTLEVEPRTTLAAPPRVVPSPRATVVFGRDSVFPLYVEGYGAGAQFPLAVSVRSERGATLWSETISLPRRGALFAGIVHVPVSRIGVGVATFTATAAGAAAGASDTTRTPLFVSFGENLPVATFDEMLAYLRFFTTPERLQAVRNASAEQRATAWAAFLAATDPEPGTPVHEGLRDYFGRVRVANERFREDGGAGWSSDRGMVYVALGDPDQVYEQGTADVSQRGRAQVWEYREYGLQLVFIDQSGFGRWRLTTSSEAEFQSALRRRQER